RPDVLTVAPPATVGLFSTDAKLRISELMAPTAAFIAGSLKSPASMNLGEKMCAKYAIPCAPWVSASQTCALTWSVVGGPGLPLANFVVSMKAQTGLPRPQRRRLSTPSDT